MVSTQTARWRCYDKSGTQFAFDSAPPHADLRHTARPQHPLCVNVEGVEVGARPRRLLPEALEV
jgi:hypothetical protein